MRLTIGQVSAKLGVARGTITGWETAGACTPVLERIAGRGNQRVYEPWQVLRLQAVAEGRLNGLETRNAILQADDLVAEWYRTTRKLAQ